MLRTLGMLLALAGAAWGHYRGDNQVQVVEMQFAKHPAWSPDGQRLAFAGGTSKFPQIYILEVGTGALTKVTSLERHCEHPTWSPDGSRIAFQSEGWSQVPDRGIEFSQLMSIQTDGTGLQELTSAIRGERDWEPAWSPTGQEIAFVTNRLDSSWTPLPWTLAVLNVETGNIRLLGDGIDLGRALVHPTWSPDGQRLFACNGGYFPDGTLEGRLYEFDPSSDSAPTLLLRDSGGFSYPSLIENGHSVLYQSGRSSGSRLFVQNLDLKVPREIGPVTMQRESPALSPDGSTLAFAGGYPGSEGIWLAEFSEVPSSVQPSTWATVKQGRVLK